MADIFISYAKPDRDLVVKLSALFETRGWSVWWDRRLTAGDEFRDELMKQLGFARAVVVIWSRNSVSSNWVRSEAGRAQAAQKLIPVKVAGLEYKDIPPPFDVLHTEDIGDEELIHGAVVAQLAKPSVEPSFPTQLFATVRYHALSSFGSVGGAIQLFVYFTASLQLADWARLLVTQWRDLTKQVWIWLFAWIDISLPNAVVPFLTLSGFLVFATAGALARPRQTSEARRRAPLVRLLCLVVICGIILSAAFDEIIALSESVSQRYKVSVPYLPKRLVQLLPEFLLQEFAAFIVYSSSFAAYLWFVFMIVFGPSAGMLYLSGRRWNNFDQFFYPLTSRLPYFLAMLVVLVLLNEIAKLDLAPFFKAPKVPA
jgi:TIR domain